MRIFSMTLSSDGKEEARSAGRVAESEEEMTAFVIVSPESESVRISPPVALPVLPGIPVTLVAIFMISMTIGMPIVTTARLVSKTTWAMFRISILITPIASPVVTASAVSFLNGLTAAITAFSPVRLPVAAILVVVICSECRQSHDCSKQQSHYYDHCLFHFDHSPIAGYGRFIKK
jgi:hypothetical protein